MDVGGDVGFTISRAAEDIIRDQGGELWILGRRRREGVRIEPAAQDLRHIVHDLSARRPGHSCRQ
jgi:hypothetical protein